MYSYIDMLRLNGLVPVHDPKDVATVHSGRWNTGTNPDLTFTSVDPDSHVPDRRILEKFPRSQHQPSIVVPRRLALPVPSKAVKRWNFRKANWSHYNQLTNKLAKSFLPLNSPDVDLAYQGFCNVIRTAARNSIPRGRRNNHIPCWDAECENLYGNFCSRLKEATLTGLSLPCFSGSTRNAQIDGPRQFRPSTFRTLAEKHGVY